MVIGVTGYTGFVGKHLVEKLSDSTTIRKLNLRDTKPADLNLVGIDVIVHLAGKAHQMKKIDDSLYYKVNHELTAQLGQEAKKAGVSQFIFVSSAKVYGDHNLNSYYDELSECKPTDAYGKSKLLAEESLNDLASEQFSIAIIRPPLIYGPGVKGNMYKLLEISKRGIYLPFAGVNNQRSIVSIDNLLALINHLIKKQKSGTFIAGDNEPVTTETIVKRIRQAMGIRINLLPMPDIFHFILRKTQPKIYARLFGSFIVDNSNTNKILQFTPPHPTDESIELMSKWFLSKTQ